MPQGPQSKNNCHEKQAYEGQTHQPQAQHPPCIFVIRAPMPVNAKIVHLYKYKKLC